MKFEWDPIKDMANVRKHGVSFREACQVFSDQNVYSSKKSYAAGRATVLRENAMKKEYDFSKGVRGKFYRPPEKLETPVYLDRDVVRSLRRLVKSPGDLSSIVNKMLLKDLEVQELLHKK